MQFAASETQNYRPTSTMRKFTFLLLLLSFARLLPAQAPFTTPNQYAWTLEKNLVYGTAVNYMGLIDTLRLDLYKPLGDNNPNRPLLVLAHGGSWLAGCKEDISPIALEMAGRGYVVATVNYRLGWHKDDYVPAPNCLLDGTQKNLYAADSCEIIRAIYRGQQDVKGAIRWLKARHIQDSTDACRVLVGGESAGAFLALAVGFLDRPGEKPDCCADLPDAPTPDPNLFNQTTPGCVSTFWSIPPGSLTRPDLGAVDGLMNQNGQDANVLGVLSFFGGVPAEALSKDWLGGPDTPAVYLFHQTCDGIVPFGYSQPFFVISNYCNTGCTPWHYNYPHIYGNGAIAAYFDASPEPPCFTTDFVPCDAFNPDLALLDCVRFANNGSYHFTANVPLRAQHAADYFSPFLAAPPCSPGATNCTVAVQEPVSGLHGLQPKPNPFAERLALLSDRPTTEPIVLELSDLTGRVVWRAVRVVQPGENELFHDPDFPPGMYVLRATGKDRSAAWILLHP